MADRKLTQKQIDVLRDLMTLRDRPQQCSRQSIQSERHGIERSAWATPQDFGGGDGSHHSGTAKRLAQMGLVDRYNYHTDRLNHFTGKAKGACVYRINDAGIAAIKEMANVKETE